MSTRIRRTLDLSCEVLQGLRQPTGSLGANGVGPSGDLPHLDGQFDPVEEPTLMRPGFLRDSSALISQAALT
jgi:hypothetical protein